MQTQHKFTKQGQGENNLKKKCKNPDESQLNYTKFQGFISRRITFMSQNSYFCFKQNNSKLKTF